MYQEIGHMAVVLAFSARAFLLLIAVKYSTYPLTYAKPSIELSPFFETFALRGS